MSQARTERQAGFALIVALLSLLLLTFLGIALATITSTELQIANNYKWNLQAKYAAESGLELAKRFLREQTAWQALVPLARPTANMNAQPTGWTLARAGRSGEVSRNFENFDCDAEYNVGYGVVMDLAGFTFPMQNIGTFFGTTFGATGTTGTVEVSGGTFTVWLRRPISINGDGTIQDYTGDDLLLVTAEGTAPYGEGAAIAQYALRARAVRTIELAVRKVDPGDCENSFQGQTGMGALGANYDPCTPVTGAGLPSGSGTPVTEENTGR